MDPVLLALADDEHLMGHRHSEWVGIAPFLEEDLAFASIGQDELGHALALYGVLAEDAERLALRRAPGGWRSCWLVEQPCRAWEEALVRHWLYDTAERFRWEALTASSVPGVAALAGRALLEEDYHRRHAGALIDRLLDATEASRARVADALETLLPLGVALWESIEGDASAWRGEIATTLACHDLEITWPTVNPTLQGGRTVRSEHFDEIHHALTEVLSIDPDATW